MSIPHVGGVAEAQRSEIPERPHQLRFSRVCGGLSAKDDVEAGKQQLHLRPRDSAHALFEQCPFEGDDLRDIRDRVFRQPCHPCRQEHVAGRSRPSKIARERDAHHRGYPASIQGITLDDNDRSTKSGP